MVCRDFILPEGCKPCLLLFAFQFAKIIVPYPSVSTLAVLALPPTIALTRTFVLVIIGMQLIFIGKWRHRRLDYLSAQQSIAVKDAQRGEANSLTDLLGCATSHPEITEDIRR